MFIKNIIEEVQTTNESEDLVTHVTELIQVKKAIEQLDGVQKTAVVLERDKENFMIIGGPTQGKYAVYAQLKRKMYVMSNKYDVVKLPMDINVGGKVGSYPSKRCMNIDMVLEAAKHFADRGSLAQTFNWESP